MAAPLVAADVDLTSLPYFPVLRRRLFRSVFHLKATDSEWRAGVTLWVRSFDQMPAGSLPDDDLQLQRLAGLARQPHKWRRVREMALHGWVRADDGRLYHETVAEVVNDAASRRKRVKPESNRVRTRREPPLESTTDFDDSMGRDSPPKSPPGDLLSWNGVRPLGDGLPMPLDPKKLGHSPPCACANCERWAKWQRRIA
jgi:hypothetical protein